MRTIHHLTECVSPWTGANIDRRLLRESARGVPRRDQTDDLTDELLDGLRDGDYDADMEPLSVVEDAHPGRVYGDLTTFLAADGDVPLREAQMDADVDDNDADGDDDDDGEDDDLADENLAEILEALPLLRAELEDDLQTAVRFIEWAGSAIGSWRQRYA